MTSGWLLKHAMEIFKPINSHVWLSVMEIDRKEKETRVEEKE